MGKLILTGYVDAKSHCARQRNCTSLKDIHRYLTGGLKFRVQPPYINVCRPNNSHYRLDLNNTFKFAATS